MDEWIDLGGRRVGSRAVMERLSCHAHVDLKAKESSVVPRVSRSRSTLLVKVLWV